MACPQAGADEADSINEFITRVQRRVSHHVASLGNDEDEVAAAALRQQLQTTARELAHLQVR